MERDTLTYSVNAIILLQIHLCSAFVLSAHFFNNNYNNKKKMFTRINSEENIIKNSLKKNRNSGIIATDSRTLRK